MNSGEVTEYLKKYKKIESFVNTLKQIHQDFKAMPEGNLWDIIEESKVAVSSNSLGLLAVNELDLDILMSRYVEQIYYMYQDEISVEPFFEDFEEYAEAIADKENPKYFAARIVGMSMVAEMLKLYSSEELIEEENVIKLEIDTGLLKRLIDFSEGVDIAPRTRMLLEHKEQYKSLITSWKEKDFECYCELDNYSEYLEKMLKSKGISKEKQIQVNEYLKKINVLRHSDLTDIVEHKEQIKEFFDDFILSYEILIREDLLKNIFEASQDKVKLQTVECVGDGGQKEEISFNGIIIDSGAQIDSMLLHFLDRPKKVDHLSFGKYFIEKRREISVKRGLKSEEDVPNDDPELFSVLRHFVEVLSDPTIVDAIAEYEDTKNMEHICTQTISKDKIKKVPGNSYALLFDKNGVGVEDIILTSRVNLESIKGIDNALKEKKRENVTVSELSYTSVPLNELVDSELETANNEIDLFRAFIKPSALCFFANVPMNNSQKKTFVRLKQLAEKRGLIITFVNLTALNKEKENDKIYFDR